MIGEHLRRSLTDIGIDPICTYADCEIEGMRQLDICNEAKVLSLFKEVLPDIVYLTAAKSNVDYCEENPRETYAVNVTGTKYVVEAVNQAKAKLVFFSSECLFDGLNGPYREGDPADPICEYGRQKLAAEHTIALQAADYLIIRTNMVYGSERHGKNFGYALGRALKAKKPMEVPNDRIVNPTYAADLAKVVVELVLSGTKGVFNVAGPERLSRYDFALKFANVFGFDATLIRSVSSSEMTSSAKRPLNAGLVTEKVFSVSKTRLVNVEQGLRDMAREVRFNEA